MILWVAAALAFVAEWSAPGQGMSRIGYALVAVILISGAFSFLARISRRADPRTRFAKLLPRQVSLLRGGSVLRLAVEQLCPATSFCSNKVTS